MNTPNFNTQTQFPERKKVKEPITFAYIGFSIFLDVFYLLYAFGGGDENIIMSLITIAFIVWGIYVVWLNIKSFIKKDRSIFNVILNLILISLVTYFYATMYFDIAGWFGY